MGRDDTTDKMYPPKEERSGLTAPIPLLPSIREEFLAHRKHIDDEVTKTRKAVEAALLRLGAPPEVTAAGATAKLKGGALAGLRYGSLFLVLGEALAQVAGALGHQEVAGPILTLIKLLKGE